MNNFILLCHWNGRFGNRLHQYAYGVTYKRLHKVDFILPSNWEGTKLFKTQHHIVSDNDHLRLYLNQTRKVYDNLRTRTAAIRHHFPTARFINAESPLQCYAPYGVPVFFDNVCAYNSQLFSQMNKQHLLNVFEFSDEVKQTPAYQYYDSIKGTYDIAHLRRDDISNPTYNKSNPQGYSVISKESYLKAFSQHGYNPDNIIWVSDDHSKKWHTNRPTTPVLGWYYPEGSQYMPGIVFDWLEDFLKLYFARTIFRANSSFSWWAAFLSPTAKVYSPVLTRQHIYGIDGMEEIDVNFVEGNHPHWMYNQKDIIIPP